MPEIEPLRAAIFGGSFDPVHGGHLEVARLAQEAFKLERVIFIPAAAPPHKLDRELAPAHMRLAMTLVATALEPSWEVSSLELGREGPSYTYDTLLEIPEHLRFRLVTKKDGGIAPRNRDLELFLILGSDNLAGLPQWKNAEDIVALAQPIVVWRGQEPKPGRAAPGDIDLDAAADEALAPLAGQLSGGALERLRAGFLAVPPHPASSTAVRATFARGELPDANTVHPEVQELIVEQSLYGWPEAAGNPFAPRTVDEDDEFSDDGPDELPPAPIRLPNQSAPAGSDGPDSAPVAKEGEAP